MTSWTSQSNEGQVGNIVAKRYVNGESENSLSSGIVLAHADPELEEILLGRMNPKELAQQQKAPGWRIRRGFPGLRGIPGIPGMPGLPGFPSSRGPTRRPGSGPTPRER